MNSNKPSFLNSSASSKPPSRSVIPVSSPVKQRVLVPSTPMSLKRKREPEVSSSPTKLTPTVLIPVQKRPVIVPRLPVSPVKKPSAAPPLRVVTENDGVIPIRPNAASSQGSSRKEEPPVASPASGIPHPVTKLRVVTDNDGVLPDRSANSSESSGSSESSIKLGGA